MKSTIYILILAALGCSNGQVSIIELPFFSVRDTSILNNTETISITKYFVAENYADNKEANMKIAGYVDSIIVNNDAAKLHLFFYQGSTITNFEHLKAFPRDIDRHSQEQDMIFVYHWDKQSKKLQRTKYKKGQQIEPVPPVIKIEDVK